jgi:glycerate-2-kinase
MATDGEDGPTDAAGAAVDGSTFRKGKLLGLDAVESLKRNDSYHFLEKTNSLIKTGPTGTNVNDLVLMFSFTE